MRVNWFPLKASNLEVKTLWHLLGLRSSLGPRVCVIFIIPGSLSPFFVDRANYGGSKVLWFGLIALAQICFTISMITFRKIIHRNSQSESHPVLTLLAFLASQSLRGCIIGALIVNVGLADDPNYAFRLLSGGLLFTTVLSILAVSIAVFDQHSNMVKNLEAKTQELEFTKNSVETRLQLAKSNLREYVNRVVTPRITEINERLNELKAGANKVQTVTELQSYLDDELRPLSYQLAHSHAFRNEYIQDVAVKKTFRLPGSVELSKSIRPALSTALFLITLVASAQRTMTPLETLPLAFVSTCLLFGYFTLVRKIVCGRDVSVWIALIYVLCTFTFAIPLILWFTSATGVEHPQYIEFAATILGVIFGLANLGYTILTIQQKELAAQLQKAVTELNEVVAILKQQEWVARRRISFLMHGTLQSALNAAVLKLSNSKELTSQLVDQICVEISNALNQVFQDDTNVYSFQKVQEDITHVWQGTTEIIWDISSETLTKLGKSPVTAECLGEVVREVVSNAVRHGNADQIEIGIKTYDSQILIEAKDNGNVAATSNMNNVGSGSTNFAQSNNVVNTVTAGLGSELLNEVCSSWKLIPNKTTGMTLSAKLPISD